MNIPTYADGSVRRRFLADPWHAWLRVPLSDLDELGIRNQITMFSYFNDKYAYLEEDCDYETYMDAMNEVGITVNVQFGADSKTSSFVRRLPNFPPAREGRFAMVG
jgi:hypothetical protein